jgi:hypothetical protein
MEGVNMDIMVFIIMVCAVFGVSFLHSIIRQLSSLHAIYLKFGQAQLNHVKGEQRIIQVSTLLAILAGLDDDQTAKFEKEKSRQSNYDQEDDG